MWVGAGLAAPAWHVWPPGPPGPVPRLLAGPARARAALARPAHPGPSGRGAGEGGRTAAPNDLRCLALCAEFSADRARPPGGIRRKRGPLGSSCDPNRPRYEARPGGRRTIFDMRRPPTPEVVPTRGPAQRLLALMPGILCNPRQRTRPAGRSPQNERRSTHVSGGLPAWFGAPPELPPLARAWAARDDRGSEPESEAQR
jgi:hypothetical protein